MLMAMLPLGGRGGDKLAALFLDGAQHLLDPVLVVQHIEALVLGRGTAEQRLHADRLGVLVGALDPLLGTAREVVPLGQRPVVAFLTAAKLFQVIRRAHARDVEEVFVLTDTQTAVLGRLALGREAIDGDFALIHGNRSNHTNLRGELVHQVDIGVEAEIAGLVDDGIGTRLAELLLDPLLLLVDRAHLGVEQPGPQQHVAVLVGVEATLALGPAIGVHRLGAAGVVVAAIHGGGIVPVHGADVVAVGAVLGPQLPVAVEGVGRGATQDLQAFRGLIDDVVDDLGGLAQILLERLDVIAQTAEQEALVVLEARHALEVMGAVLLEAIRVGTSLFVLGLEQLAVVLEGPAMEGAGEGTLVATLLAAQGGATVGTGVDQAVQLTLLVTGDHHRLAAHGHGHEVARLGDLALMGQEQPVAFEDVLHLQFEEGRVGEHAAMAAEDALLGVVLDGATDALLELIKLAGHDPYPRYLVVLVRRTQGVARRHQGMACRSDLGGTRQLAGLVLLVFLGPRTGMAMLQLGLIGLGELDVEHYLGEGAIQLALGDLALILDAVGRHHQLLAGSEGEVIEGVGVARQVDLGGQVLVTRRGDEVMDMRRTPAMAAQGLENHVGGGTFRHAVAGGDDAACGVAPFAVRIDGAAHVVFALGLVEEGVTALGVAVPDLDLGPGDRVAIDVTHLAVQPHHLGLGIAAVVHPREVFGFWGAGHVERALDGARGAAGTLGLGVGRVLAHIEKVVEAQARGEQAELGLAAQGVEQVDGGPVLLLADIEVIDQLEQVGEQTMHDLLGALVAALLVEASDGLQEVLHFGGVENLHGHGRLSSFVMWLCSARTELAGFFRDSGVVLAHGGWVTTQRLDADLHIGEKRQVADQLLQFRVVLDVEDTDVRVAAGHAPQVTPLAGALQLL